MPDTAVALMRSRYTAYVRGAIDDLIESHDASTRGEVDRAEVARWSRQTAWLGLEIVETVRGGVGDDDGIVEFVARGRARRCRRVDREPASGHASMFPRPRGVHNCDPCDAPGDDGRVARSPRRYAV